MSPRAWAIIQEANRNPEMLNVDLDESAECCDPACRAEIAPPDEQHRFCPKCGAAQVFECEACPTRPGALLRVAEDSVCPRCGAVYMLCRACRYPLRATLSDPLVCPDGCAAGITEARGGWAAELAGVDRTGTVAIHPRALDVGEPQRWCLEEAITRPVCRFGRLYFLTARGVVRCLEEETGQEAPHWRPVPIAPPDALPPADACLQVSERFLLVGWGGKLVACALSDGEEAFRLSMGLRDLRWAVVDNRLLLCGRDGIGTLHVELRDTAALCQGGDGLLRIADFPVRSSRPPQLNWPAAGEGVFVFTDLDGNLRKIGVSCGEEFASVWENSRYNYVSTPAVMRGQILAVVHSPGTGAVLLRAPLQGSHAQEVQLDGLTPDYSGPRFTCDERMYLFDHDSHNTFREYSLQALASPSRPISMGVTMTGDQTLQDVVVLEDVRGGAAWIATVQGETGMRTARMVHTKSQDRRPTIGGGRAGSLALSASDRRLFICDLQSGEVLVHQIPRA